MLAAAALIGVEGVVRRVWFRFSAALRRENVKGPPNVFVFSSLLHNVASFRCYFSN
jgi:hypothetical protein